jgi:hypothetical protein
MSKINKMIIQAMSMIRSKNIFVGFCVNSLFDIDRNLILHRAEALFHVYGDTLVSRGRFCGFYRGKDGFNRLKDLYLNGKRLYDYSKPRANMVARFSSEFLIDDKVYETQKQKGIDEFLNAKTQKGLDKRKVAVKMLKRKRSIAEICEVLSLSLPDYNKLMEGDVNFEELA